VERYDLCLKVGLCLEVEGRILEAVRYCQECYNWRKAHYDQDDPSRLASQHALATAYEANGQVKEAVQLLERWCG
jgi:tetratricopeptide (TPR) repeat protein